MCARCVIVSCCILASCYGVFLDTICERRAFTLCVCFSLVLCVFFSFVLIYFLSQFRARLVICVFCVCVFVCFRLDPDLRFIDRE